MAQITLNSSGVASNGTLALQSNGTTTAVTIDASQNVGIGTSSPLTPLHVVGAIQSQRTGGVSQYARMVNSGGTATFISDNQASGAYTGFQFQGLSTASGTPTTYATIDSSGNLLVGTTDSSIASGNGVKILPAGSGPSTVSSSSTNSTTCLHMYSSGASAYRFYVGWGGTIYATSTTISAISDIRFKENVRDLDAGLAEIMALKPRLYDWKEGKGADIKNARGFIAQEFETVFPDLIDEWKDEAPEGEDPYKSVRQDLIPVLVKAIQEMKAIIDTQASTITQLQADVAALKGTA